MHKKHHRRLHEGPSHSHHRRSAEIHTDGGYHAEDVLMGEMRKHGAHYSPKSTRKSASSVPKNSVNAYVEPHKRGGKVGRRKPHDDREHHFLGMLAGAAAPLLYHAAVPVAQSLGKGLGNLVSHGRWGHKHGGRVRSHHEAHCPPHHAHHGREHHFLGNLAGMAQQGMHAIRQNMPDLRKGLNHAPDLLHAASPLIQQGMKMAPAGVRNVARTGLNMARRAAPHVQSLASEFSPAAGQAVGMGRKMLDAVPKFKKGGRTRHAAGAIAKRRRDQY